MTKIAARNSEGYDCPIGLTADAVVFTVTDDDLCVLLVRRDDPPSRGRLALPGGFVGAGEEPAQTVARKLEEKTGIPPIYLEQLRTYAKPRRDPRGWLPSVAHLALVPSELLPDDGRQAAWYPVGSIPALPFDHTAMVEDGLERIRGKLWYSNIAVGLLPPEFTIAQARRVYEQLAGVVYDPGNFSRDLQASGLVVETGHTSAGRVGRPARLFRFISVEPAWMPRYARSTVSQPG
ncbi:MAG TPA: NUDIX domain-containing protein [Gaiellaceae bacterium]